MIPAFVEAYQRSRNLSRQDALQTFLQVVVLKNLRHPHARLIGGAALVLGHHNPRFSEDIDLAGVSDPKELEPSLVKGIGQLQEWLGVKVSLRAPKPSGKTWVVSTRIDFNIQARLHVDSQAYPAQTSLPLVIEFAGLTPFVCESVSVREIMADRLVALAYRRYLSGRDLFDLWFHWLRQDDRKDAGPSILEMTLAKINQRDCTPQHWRQELQRRLSTMRLDRARTEWNRYLPADFKRESVQNEIIERIQEIPLLLAL